MREKRMAELLDDVVKKSVNEVVAGDFRVLAWEDDKLGSKDAESVGDVQTEVGR